jgi:hypothetical protein
MEAATLILLFPSDFRRMYRGHGLSEWLLHKAVVSTRSDAPTAVLHANGEPLNAATQQVLNQSGSG